MFLWRRRQWHPTPVLLPGDEVLLPMDGGAWRTAVHGVAKSWTWLSDFTFTFHFHTLEKEMATQFNVLAWRIPGTGEPGGLPSMGSHRVGHYWSDTAAAACSYWHFLIEVDFVDLFSSVIFLSSSRSLLIDSCIFSILFSRFLIIFTIIILNYFSGNFPISSWFFRTSVFLVCSFICAAVLCLFFSFFFKVLCLRSPFPRLQEKLNSFLEEGWILISFWLLPSWGWSSGLCEVCEVCVRFIGWGLCWIFICLIGFPLIGKAEWSGTPVYWWLGMFSLCLLFRWVILPRVLLVVGWFWVLYSSGFLFVSSQYLILPRVSFLVV